MSDAVSDKPERARRRRPALRWMRPDKAVSRLAAAVQNGVEIARFGGLGDREFSPHEQVAETATYKLRHYFPGEGKPGARPPVVLVPPLMLTAEVWDVSPDTSAVAALRSRGADPWVVDFGSPEDAAGGLERTLADHVLAVSACVRQVREETGRDVHLMGYSQGGIFCYQAAAHLRGEGIASLVGFGSPVDTHQILPPFLPEELALEGMQRLTKLQTRLFPSGLPSWATKAGFKLMDPIKTVRSQIDFLSRLYDREALQENEGTRRFLEDEGWVAYPGPALRDFSEQLVAHNGLLRGGMVIDDEPVTLADVQCPVLIFTGATDTIAPPSTVRAIGRAAPLARIYEVGIQAGHFGLVVGSRSAEITWPTVSQWIDWCEGTAALPEKAEPLVVRDKRPERGGSTVDEVSGALSLVLNIGRNLLGESGNLVNERANAVARVSGAVGSQFGRLSRLASLRSDTRIGMGLALAERAKETPESTFFLYEGRAYSFEAADTRVDNVVRGFISLGVRHGDFVAVAMEGRPSALTATVALDRIGAIPVLTRPDLPLADQLAACPVEHVVTDPENAEEVRRVVGRDVFVLGGGGDPRTLPEGLVDMEAIDPEQVGLPAWYEPNPGTAAELSMVLMSVAGEKPRVIRISNRRWATSAFGTAAACALSSRDTLYCRAPSYHPTGALVCLAGALVSGARLALTTVDGKASFWDDVRRYGVNVVFYTGTFCRELVNGPETPAERHHPIRLFAGSGMPRGVWKRLVERFAPASVVEFYATTEGNAVLANLGGKVGSVGRPLPGGANLEVAAWHLDRGEFYERPSGFKRPATPGDVGMLLAEVDPERGDVQGRPLRGVFEAGDAWVVTGDLVHRDSDGDYWLVDHVGDVVHGRGEGVPTLPIEDAITDGHDAIDLAEVYGIALPGCEFEVPMAALTVRPGHKLDPAALRAAVTAALPSRHRPVVVRVLDDLPMTAGLRVRKRPLREAGLGLDAAEGETLWLDPSSEAYVPLEPDDVDRLVDSLTERQAVRRNA